MISLPPELLILSFLFSFMFIKIIGSRITEYRQTRSERERPRKKRHAQPPIKKPKTEREFPYIEGSGDRVVSIGIVLIFVSLLLPYQIWYDAHISGLLIISDLIANIDFILWAIEAGNIELAVLVGLELLAPMAFLITAIMAWKFRGSERLPSYRKSEGDNLAVVRIVGKLHLLYFAASIIALLVYYQSDILHGARQLLPIIDGDYEGNWGLGFWLGGLSGLLIAYPERIAASTIGESSGYVIRDVWKGIKDPWICWWNWLRQPPAARWSTWRTATTPPKLFTSRDDAQFLQVYYASTALTWLISIGLMFSLSFWAFILEYALNLYDRST